VDVLSFALRCEMRFLKAAIFNIGDCYCSFFCLFWPTCLVIVECNSAENVVRWRYFVVLWKSFFLTLKKKKSSQKGYEYEVLNSVY